MSDYLIHDLGRTGVLVRGRREIAALHGATAVGDGAMVVRVGHECFSAAVVEATAAAAGDDGGDTLLGPQ